MYVSKRMALSSQDFFGEREDVAYNLRQLTPANDVTSMAIPSTADDRTRPISAAEAFYSPVRRQTNVPGSCLMVAVRVCTHVRA